MCSSDLLLPFDKAPQIEEVRNLQLQSAGEQTALFFDQRLDPAPVTLQKVLDKEKLFDRPPLQTIDETRQIFD